MLEDLLNFPNYVLRSSSSVNEICREISKRHRGKFPSFIELVIGLRQKTDSVERWIEYSENKRGTPSWYLLRKEKKYSVGYLDTNGNLEEGVYDDPCFACALFIKLEMEERLKACD